MMQHAEKTVHVAVTLEGVQNVRFESERKYCHSNTRTEAITGNKPFTALCATTPNSCKSCKQAATRTVETIKTLELKAQHWWCCVN
jgi:hypothetical protein